ncbi:PfkB family carbohydrate kinase [Streptomyces sp. NPDC049627]|uniref:PfkB family carbohydrate kinase n=1 Tax=Streptomyces sp. NPDC049627 TaxID=3365595 RepID=UPI003797893F
MDLRAALAAHRLVAIVRGDDPDAALRTVLALAEEGIELIEVSLTGKDALSVIERARHTLGPDRPLGAGTVLTAEDARATHDAGADATAFTDEGIHTVPAPRTAVVEPVGAGDAFAAGFLAGLLRGATATRALRLGHITAASALRVTGDHGPLPDPQETEALLGLSAREWAER